MNRRWLLALAVVLTSMAFACQLIVGIERSDKVERPEAPPDTGPPADAGPAIPDPCEHVTLPSKPDTDDDINGAIPPVVVALRTIEIPTEGGLLGFDLDGVCTCESRPGTAEGGASSCVAPDRQCDGDGGIDNQLRTLVAGFTGLPYDFTSAAADTIAKGQRTALLRISSYNGKANDKDVTVELLGSEGLRVASKCADAGDAAPDSPTYPPGWCGDDAWSVSRESLQGDRATSMGVAAGTGYVKNFQLVVQVKGEAAIPFGSYDLHIGSPVTVGTLVPLGKDLKPRDPSVPVDDPDVLRLWQVKEAIVGGRVPIGDLLALVGVILAPGTFQPNDGGKAYLCDIPLVFGSLKAPICAARDIPAKQAFDFDPGAACDAVSVAVKANYEPVQLGEVLPSTIVPNHCYPTGDGGTIGGQTSLYSCE